MKIESLREVKARLSKLIKDLPSERSVVITKNGRPCAVLSERSVVITKNGRPCAVLLPVTEETDLESLLLSQRKDFWQMFDRAHSEGNKKGFTKFEDLPG